MPSYILASRPASRSPTLYIRTMRRVAGRYDAAVVLRACSAVASCLVHSRRVWCTRVGNILSPGAGVLFRTLSSDCQRDDLVRRSPQDAAPSANVHDSNASISAGQHAAHSSSGPQVDRKSTRLNSSHTDISRMPSSA